MTPDDDALRLDKWLWAARFFKTRALAAEAINGGKVWLNGARTKPAHAVRVGDELQIRKSPRESFVVIVQALARARGPAKVAGLLYEETPESRALREQLAEQHRLVAASAPQSGERPTKRHRRFIVRFTGRELFISCGGVSLREPVYRRQTTRAIRAPRSFYARCAGRTGPAREPHPRRGVAPRGHSSAAPRAPPRVAFCFGWSCVFFC